MNVRSQPNKPGEKQQTESEKADFVVDFAAVVVLCKKRSMSAIWIQLSTSYACQLLYILGAVLYTKTVSGVARDERRTTHKVGEEHTIASHL